MESIAMSRTMGVSDRKLYVGVNERRVVGGNCYSVETEDMQIASFWSEVEPEQAWADAHLFVTAKERIEAANRMQTAAEAVLSSLSAPALAGDFGNECDTLNDAVEVYKKLKEYKP